MLTIQQVEVINSVKRIDTKSDYNHLPIFKELEKSLRYTLLRAMANRRGSLHTADYWFDQFVKSMKRYQLLCRVYKTPMQASPWFSISGR